MNRDDTKSEDSDFAALWSSDGVTRSLSPTATGIPADLPFLFSSGQRFGAYVIVRPLGKGGMGQVYEAEETESGRRVALKLLSRGLGDDEERERFLREGQLAASLSHPHCVYVFGTSEIQGFPVIAMELVPEGTLKDLVGETPMTGAAAVDSILPVTDGLEAAAQIGILHRDVKPSNCFVHRDGRVLVGDFGLSVAATSRDAQGGGASILGTPGFASPEQLKGQALDVRSDIYSVGATLFYLLARRAPFEDRTTTSLLEKIAAAPPPSLLAIRPELPKGLAAIVAKCLAKSPAERYPDYEALRNALEPFGTSRLAPAHIVRRALAGILDSWIVGLPMVPLVLLLRIQSFDFVDRADAWITSVAAVLIAAVYYGLTEGLWGAGAGKAIFGLRVVDEHHVPPGVRVAATRALIFEGPSQLLKQSSVFVMVKFIPDISAGFVTTVAGFVYLIFLFSIARKSNGYFALHDRWTATRVVRRRARAEKRDRERRTATDAASIEGSDRIGPYIVPAGTATTVAARTLTSAYDDRLQRRVWIEQLPAGTPALPALRRDLGRSTRLRWLAGRRDGEECWDAYEAVDGEPLVAVAATPRPWSRVRHWLSDLASEIAPGLEDGSLPQLSPDRLWLGRDGHVRLCEWSVINAESSNDPDSPATDLAGAQRFVYGAGAAALMGKPFHEAKSMTPDVPLPLSARTLLLSLRDGRLSNPRELLDRVNAAASAPAAFSRSRRAAQLALNAALPVIMTLISIGGIVVLASSSRGIDRKIVTLDACLNSLDNAEKKLRKGPDPAAEQRKHDIGVYLAEHLAATIQDPNTWERTLPDVKRNNGRERARQALERHRVRTPEEVRRAEETVGDLIEDTDIGLQKLMNPRALAAVAVGLFGCTFVVVACFAAVGALLFGNGFTFRPCGAALVNRRGQPISRVRALARAAIVWSPIVGIGFALKFGPKIQDASLAWIALEVALLAIFIAAAGWAMTRPVRGIQDRLAGTWIVPR
jgi:eukaryotic-like serine/threonine-protein kinase